MTVETPTVETSPSCLCGVGEGITVAISGGEAAPQLPRVLWAAFDVSTDALPQFCYCLSLSPA